MKLETLKLIFIELIDDYASIKFVVNKTGLCIPTVSKTIKYMLLLDCLDTKKYSNMTLYKIKNKITLSDVINKYK